MQQGLYDYLVGDDGPETSIGEFNLFPQMLADILSWNPPLPQKGFCSFSANVGNVSQASIDAIKQIYNNAGVGVDFVNGPAQVTGIDQLVVPKASSVNTMRTP